ncbi:MAG: hypothetical protein ACE5MI_03870 [Acidimicrobiia bacterium]
MVSEDTLADSFTEFFEQAEPRLRHALVAAAGLEVGVEAAADALVYGWEHWQRVRRMSNPAGYLYRVARSRAKRLRRPRVTLPVPPANPAHLVEPGLHSALVGLSEKQRVAVILVHSLGWTHREVAELLGGVDRDGADPCRSGAEASAAVAGRGAMSTDLLEQLRAYGDHYRASVPRVELEQVTQPVYRPSPPVTAGRSRWRWLAALAAAGLVLVVIGAVALLSPRGGEGVPVLEEPPVVIHEPGESISEGLPDGRATRLASLAADGEVWALTAVREGVEVLSRFDGVAWTSYPEIPVTHVAYIGERIRTSPTGDIWVVSQDESYSDDPANPDPWFRLSHFDGSAWSVHELGHLPLLGSFEVSPDGSVWFGTWVGVARFDGQRLEEWRFVTGEVASCCGVKWVAFAPDGTVWTQGDKGVSRFDGDDWTHYTPDDGLASSHVHSPVQFAANGTVWASGREGVSVFDGSTWEAYTSAEGLDADVEAWRVILTPDGVAWAVAQESLPFASWDPTTARGLYRFDGATWQPLTETAPPPLWKIAFDDDGIAWALTQVGVVSFDGSAWNVHDPGVGVVEGYELSPKDGSAWAYGRGGVARFDGQSWHPLADEDGQAFDLVKDLIFSPDGHAWLTTGAHVTRLAPAG